LNDTVEGFNELLKAASKALQDGQEYVWDTSYDIFPDAICFTFASAKGLRGMLRQYPWMLDAPVENFYDCVRYAVYKADYTLSSDQYVQDHEELSHLMYLSWMHLARTGKIVEVQTTWDEASEDWVVHSELKDQEVKEALTAKIKEHNDIQLDQLGWSLEEARAELVKQLGVTSRQYLNNGQMVEWIQYCAVCLQNKKQSKRSIGNVNGQ
jgi:hypothetical protein